MIQTVDIFNPDPRSWDWGGIFGKIFETITGAGKQIFGNKLQNIAEKMSTVALPDFTKQEWRLEYGVAYGFAVFFCALMFADAGARLAITNNNATEKAQDAIHPGKVIVAGIFIPALLGGLVFLVDLFRRMAMYVPAGNASPDGASWWTTFSKLPITSPGSFGEWILNQLLTTVGAYLLQREQELVTNMLYVFALPLIIGYVFIRKDKGRWLFQICMSIVLSLSLSYPVQVAILRLAARYVGTSLEGTVVATLIAAALPFVMASYISGRIDFVKIAGGKAVLEGKAKVTPTDDRPQTVRTAEDLSVAFKSLLPVKLTGTAQGSKDTTPTSMHPRVLDKPDGQTLVAQAWSLAEQRAVQLAMASPDPKIKAVAATYTAVKHIRNKRKSTAEEEVVTDSPREDSTAATAHTEHMSPVDLERPKETKAVI